MKYFILFLALAGCESATAPSTERHTDALRTDCVLEHTIVLTPEYTLVFLATYDPCPPDSVIRATGMRRVTP